MKAKNWRKVAEDRKAALAAADVDYGRFKQRHDDEVATLRKRIEAQNATIAEAAKANESLDAERNFLRQRIECDEVALTVLSRLMNDRQADRVKTHDWRTPKPVENGCAPEPTISSRVASMLRQPNNTGI